ncbi:hypothetical protein PMI09_05291, partial [Rhizobium sp. CF122]
MNVADDVATIGTPYSAGLVEEEQLAVVGSGNEDTGSDGDFRSGFFGLVFNDRTTQTTGGTLAIAWGSDNADNEAITSGAGNRSVAFGPAAVNALDALDLTSRGQELHYTIVTVEGGQVLLAYTGEVAPTGVPANADAAQAAHVVFLVGLSDNGGGSYQFTLIDTLDHKGAGEDTLKLDFQFTATDSDGDKTGVATFGVGVIDDTPILSSDVGVRFVEEEALAGGNEDIFPVGTEVGGVIANGGFITDKIGASLNISWGGDDSNKNENGGFTGTQVMGDRSVVFATGSGADHSVSAGEASAFLGVKSGNTAINLGDLTSGGQHLTYSLSANGTVLTAHAGNETVFTVTLSDKGDGSYAFDLDGVLDHPVKGGNAGQEDVLSFTFKFTARDGDGDAVGGNFTVNVIDDSPIANAGTTSTVEDEAVNGGNNESDGLSATAGGSLNINWGADSGNDGNGQPGDRAVAFTNADVAVTGEAGETLTSLGQAVHTVLIDGVLVGYTGETAPTAATGEGAANVVFFASVSDASSNGSYAFTLVQPLDHVAGNGENPLSLTFNYTATDSDGDKASNTFTVNVVDDVPVTRAGSTSTVEDEAVNGGNNESDGLSATAGGSLNIGWGADDNNSGSANRSVAFTNANVSVTGEAGHSLTSLGQAVHTGILADGTLVGYTGNTAPTTASGGNVVFYASLSDASDHGSYSFTLVKPLDHDNTPSNSENTLSLTFNYTATDSDGDTASNTFTVNVADDV